MTRVLVGLGESLISPHLSLHTPGLLCFRDARLLDDIQVAAWCPQGLIQAIEGL